MDGDVSEGHQCCSEGGESTVAGRSHYSWAWISCFAQCMFMMWWCKQHVKKVYQNQTMSQLFPANINFCMALNCSCVDLLHNFCFDVPFVGQNQMFLFL